MKIVYWFLSIMFSLVAQSTYANERVFTNSDLKKHQPSAVVSESGDTENLSKDVNRYSMENLSNDEIQKYKQLLETHFIDILEAKDNFKIENLIGYRQGPYYTFIVSYRENLGGLRWTGVEELLVWFRGETVVYTDLKPSLRHMKYRKPPRPQ